MVFACTYGRCRILIDPFMRVHRKSQTSWTGDCFAQDAMNQNAWFRQSVYAGHCLCRIPLDPLMFNLTLDSRL